MSSNKTEDANAALERYELTVCVVNDDFILTTPFWPQDVQQGMRVHAFLETVLAKYPDIFNILTAEMYYVPGGLIPTESKNLESEGWIRVFNNKIFTRDAEALRANSKLWTEIPDDDGSVYYVIKTPGKVKERLPLLHENMPLSGAPSTVAKKSPADLYNAKFNRFINYNCPRETESISLTLLSNVFGQFKDDCSRKPDSEMSQALATYAEAALAMAEDLSGPTDEKSLMPIFTTAFEDLYGVKLARKTKTETDGRAVMKGRLVMISELKSRCPSGDPLVQGARYYRDFYKAQLKESDRLSEGEVFPAFLITYQGPLINVYGIACVEKGQVQCEYLTSVNAGCHWTNNEELYKLTRILYAFREAFDCLDELSEAPASPPRKRQKMTRPAKMVWPYSRTFTKLGSETVVEFQYLKQLDGQRYLFEVQSVDEPHPKMLVKFTQSYGRGVHEELARSGYAPELLGFCHLSGGWKMVVMEHLESPVWKDGGSFPERDEVVKRGLEVVRNKILPLLRVKGYVHGDIRLANLMFRMDGAGDNSDPAVKLVDFDFAGDVGETTYPWNLNITSRPLAQVPCASIEFAHDDDSLKMLEGDVRTLESGAGLRHSKV